MEFSNDVEDDQGEGSTMSKKKKQKRKRALWLSDTNEVSNVESVKLIKSYTKQSKKKEEIMLRE